MPALPENETLADRLWRRVTRHESGCWLFAYPGRTNCYGTVAVPKAERAHYGRKSLSSHRAAWLLTRGAIPAGKLVCHTCDVPACCNPDHLWLGTPSDNSRDCVRKGRHGSRSPAFKRQRRGPGPELLKLAAFVGYRLAA